MNAIKRLAEPASHSDPANDTNRIGHKAVLTVSVDDVKPKPQVRQEFRNIESLAESLLTEGQQSPIIVYPKNREGKYVIQKGERRWRACRHAGISTIDIIINDHKQSDLDETAGELIENIQRDDLTGLEIARALQKFIEQDWKQVDIARRLGKSTKFVSSHLGLLKLPACAMELYEKGLCADTDTLNILRQLHELDEATCKELCKEAFERGIYRQRARDVLNETYVQMDNAQREQRYAGMFLADHVKRQGGNHQDPDPDTPWVVGTTTSVRIQVKVVKGMYSRTCGTLLTDRLSPSGEQVWLQTEEIEGESRIVCVNASALKIVKMEA